MDSVLQMIVSMLLNVFCSVGVIFINKRLVFLAGQFHFATALTIIHFLVTFAGCVGFAKLSFFEIKTLEFPKVLSICAAFCGYVAFNNLSLLTNSVSVYQISKIVCTPVIVFIEWHYYQQKQSTETLLALVPVCIGIFITVYTDHDLNWVGSFWAFLAMISNSFYTIWGKTKCQELEVSPMQMLTYQAPISAGILILTLPFLENFQGFLHYTWSPTRILFVFISCLFAFGVNFSFFLSVGQTSPLTMNVLGYVKTCLVFLGGFMFFDTPVTWQNLTGIGVTMLGLALYSKAKMPKTPPSSSKEEEDV